jgi:hypothetical protein
MVQTVGAQSNRWHIMMANTAVGPIVGGGAAADIGLSYPALARRQIRVQRRTPSMP